MSPREERRPTDAELEILNALWERGPCTVREVYDALRPGRATRYTTTLKLMQIMAEKGLVTRDESQRAHLYRAASPRERTLRGLAADMLDRVFGGSAEKLVLHALQSKKVSAGEIAKIRELLDTYEEVRDPSREGKK